MAAPPDAWNEDSRFVRRVLIVLALVGLFYVAWQLRTVIVMVFGSIVIATVFRALARPIEKHSPLPERAAVGLSILIVLGTIGLVAWLFGSEISRQVETLTETLPSALGALESLLASWGIAAELKAWVGLAGGGGPGILASAARFLLSIGAGLADTIVVIFGGIFLSLQPSLYRIGAIKLVPETKRGLIAEAMTDSQRSLRLWLQAQLVSMLIVGLMTGLGLWLLGVPSALVLALVAFCLEFIPFAGPIIASIPAILLALAVSPTLALWTAGLYLVVQQLEGNLVYPLVQQWAVHIPAALLLFALIAFGILFGVLGVIFAAPMTVVIYVLVKRLYVREALHTATPLPGEEEEA